jgi:glycerol-3-phosphate dehydrogenase (NAD(P)+)
MKNVIALAVGMAVGLGMGDNSKASIITRGLAETARLGAALGADPQTFSGLAGMGDLVATCTSPLSRNRTFGEQLGQGPQRRGGGGVTRQTAEGVGRAGRCWRSPARSTSRSPSPRPSPPW